MIPPNPVSFVKAMTRAAKLALMGEAVFVSGAVAKYREVICWGCVFQSKGQCAKCTCFVALKVLIRSESCPVGKWRRLDK
jgi:hypothetical protein